MKKRYVLFGYDSYYPEGGWHDKIGVFDTIEDAATERRKCAWNHYHLVDLETLDYVEGFY